MATEIIKSLKKIIIEKLTEKHVLTESKFGIRSLDKFLTELDGFSIIKHKSTKDWRGDISYRELSHKNGNKIYLIGEKTSFGFKVLINTVGFDHSKVFIAHDEYELKEIINRIINDFISKSNGSEAYDKLMKDVKDAISDMPDSNYEEFYELVSNMISDDKEVKEYFKSKNITDPVGHILDKLL
jgi:hypothetical protein